MLTQSLKMSCSPDRTFLQVLNRFFILLYKENYLSWIILNYQAYPVYTAAISCFDSGLVLVSLSSISIPLSWKISKNSLSIYHCKNFLSNRTEDDFQKKYASLNEAIVSVIEDYSLVSFSTLHVENKESMLKLMKVIDKANGYISVCIITFPINLPTKLLLHFHIFVFG